MRRSVFRRFLKTIKILLSRNNRGRQNKKTCIVGVCPKAGVTHLCLCLASFISSVLKKKVIYIELSDESKLLSVVGLNGTKLNGHKAYKYGGVYYILTSNLDEVNQLIDDKKAWIIIDMKQLDEQTQTIFERCDNRIVIGPLSPWCKSEYYEFVELKIKNNTRINQVLYCSRTIQNRKENDSHRRILGCNIYTIPCIEDPFLLKEQEFETLLKILQ